MPLPELFQGPRIERLNYRIFTNPDDALTALNAGEIDLVDFPITSDEPPAEGVAIDPCRDFGYYFVAFNNRLAPTDSKQFRQAFAYLLDDVKKTVSKTVPSDRVEVMDSIMVQYYGRLVNRYLPKYDTDGPDDAVAKALSTLGSELDGLADDSVTCLITTNDAISRAIMVALRERVERSPSWRASSSSSRRPATTSPTTCTRATRATGTSSAAGSTYRTTCRAGTPV
ncbi:hypothetical protein KEF29_32655 [Streptomyces tuirus]|uniref:Solute-binding protein family 5 domain-containing protein n=1 Tax=Streptomyces tuirus TaxID=68278 RepID=A0A941FJ66_9ACTN|nr:hypothetical protein [Streptomyces tuirus]